MTLQFDSEIVQCQNKYSRPICARVVTVRTVVVPRGHDVVTYDKVRKRQSQRLVGLGVVTPTDLNKIAAEGAVIARAVVESTGSDGSIIPIKFLNPGRDTCVNKSGMTAGILTSIEGIQDFKEYEMEVKEELKSKVHVPDYLSDLYEGSV